jgi:ribosomal protein S6
MLAGVMEVYEVGYLLSPLVAVEALGETVERELKALLTKAGGKVKSETAPRLLKLAYPLRKVVEHKSSVFNEAYFGSVVFEAPTDAIKELGARWRNSAVIIRLLLINYPERLMVPHFRRAPTEVANPDGSPATPALAPVTPAATLDKEIDSLLTPIA